MPLWPKEAWNHLRTLPTTTGTFASVYLPRPREEVLVLAPDGQTHAVKTVGLGDWQLAAEDGVLVVYHTRIIERDERRQGLDLMRVQTTIPCGVAVGALTSGGTGPVGPPGPQGERGEDGAPGPSGAPGRDGEDATVDDATIQRIAAAVVERLFTEPPADWAQHMPANARTGTRLQDMFVVTNLDQARLQEYIKTGDEAVGNMLRDGYQLRSEV